MNQSLINELRAHDIKIRQEIAKVDEVRRETDDPTAMFLTYARLLSARADCLNGIAVLVASNKR